MLMQSYVHFKQKSDEQFKISFFQKKYYKLCFRVDVKAWNFR